MTWANHPRDHIHCIFQAFQDHQTLSIYYWLAFCIGPTVLYTKHRVGSGHFIVAFCSCGQLFLFNGCVKAHTVIESP